MDWRGARAIETRYAGVRFRSRLEARWAVLMDALGVRWEYEPEGFDLDGVPYLPDFWLHDLGCWAEAKPDIQALPVEEARRAGMVAGRLARATRRPVVVFVDSVDAERAFADGGCAIGFVAVEGAPSGYEIIAPVDWAVCLSCGQPGLSDGSGRMPLPCGHRAFGTTRALEDAFETARAWRAWEGGR